MMSWWWVAAGVVAAVAAICNLPWFNTEKATLQYLANAKLKIIGKAVETFKASDLWKNQGVVIMVEASQLSSLKSTFDSHDVRLYAVVHEELGVEKFRNYFKEDIFLDEERIFYGPKQRWMFLMAFLRPGVWLNSFRANSAGFSGNFRGEGRLLGGLFVIGPGDQGILLQHRESEFGDHASQEDILNAIKQMKKNK